MVFSSVIFLYYFLPVALICFYASGGSKNVLLALSLIFYAWGEPLYIGLLLASIGLNYRFGLVINAASGQGRRKLVLAAGVTANLLILIVFKYLGFIAETVSFVLGHPSENPASFSIALPLGISFYTFHALSYLIDVYRRDVPAERNLRDLALYVSMFPQLVAGPIIRYKFIATELHRPIYAADRVAAGIRIFVIGLGQKVLIANTLAASVDVVFGLSSDQLSTGTAWVGIIGYTLQIYYDFGGYSLMAIGLALMIGFTFPINFNYPYISLSVTEFWRRWHISLSSWFRDYVYVPLGGNRGSAFQTYRNLFIIFLLCGIWHGASWNFVVWGLVHGTVLVIERAGWAACLERLPVPVRAMYTLLVVMIAWVFFRADDMGHAVRFLAAMFGLGPPAAFSPTFSSLVGGDVLVAFAFALMAAGPWGQAALDGLGHRLAVIWPVIDLVRVASLVLVLVLVSMSLAGGAYNPFIYFRF